MARGSGGGQQGGGQQRGGKGGRGGKPGGGGKPGVGGRKPTVGTGGHNRRRLAGRGPTPPAEQRVGHPAARRAAAAARRAAGTHDRGGDRGRRPARAGQEDTEFVVGRNPVVEALRAHVPASGLLLAAGIDHDARIEEALKLAGQRGLPVLDGSRADMDRATGGAVHQGVALQVPPYAYAHPDDVLARALEHPSPPLLVALDGVTDPRNLGAVVRSTAAFGGHGVLVPERRSAGMTAAAWKASAGAAGRIPVARAVNLVRALRDWKEAGLFVVGLAADGEVGLDDLEVAVDGLVLVVGSEGRGLSRLVSETCDLTVAIPMAGETESLNAGVAAAVALAEVARRRRLAAPDSTVGEGR